MKPLSRASSPPKPKFCRPVRRIAATLQEMRAGEVITAEVVRVEHNFVVVNAGLKSEAFIPIEQFKNDKGEIEVKAGDFVEVALDASKTASARPACRATRPSASHLDAPREGAREAGEFVTGTDQRQRQGRLHRRWSTASARSCPVRWSTCVRSRTLTPYEGKTLEFKVIKLDRKRNNVVVSRRAVVEAAIRRRAREAAGEPAGRHRASRASSRTSPTTARSSTSAASTACCTSPTWRGSASSIRREVVNVGDEIDGQDPQVRPREEPRLAGPEAARRRSVGGPRAPLSARHAPVRQGHEHRRLRRVRGNRGRRRRPGARLRNGLDQQERQSGARSCSSATKSKSWCSTSTKSAAASRSASSSASRIRGRSSRENYKRGDKVTGQIKSITDFGVFIGLPGGIDGLVHLSDLSWNVPGEEAVRNYKKGQEIEAMVLAIDPERERISLGIKQLDGDPFTSYRVDASTRAASSRARSSRSMPRAP